MPDYEGIPLMINERKKIAFHTLGCKLNFAETSTISRSFSEDKFERVPASSRADIYVINTCSVTDAADKKCRQAIRKFMHLSPSAFIAVVGCYAQLRPQEISSIPGVDLILGTNEKFSLADYLSVAGKNERAIVQSCDLTDNDGFNNSFSVGDRTRSFLKVQDGCDYGCSYCTIPMARGNSKNPSIALLKEEAGKIASRGVKEIVLTGVNIGDFGKTTGDSFAGLLSELVKTEVIERFRISSIEPNLLTNELIKLAAENEKVLPHFHIPLQSGSDKILGLMRRRYRRDVFADRVLKVKELIPSAGIGADVIVGFPGESETDFDDTFSFLEKLPLSYLHVFGFSERPGTIAAEFDDKVPFSVKELRSKKLIAMSEQKGREFRIANIGLTTKVLFENSRNEGMITGFTANYIRVEYPWNPKLGSRIKTVELKGIAPSGRMQINLID